MLNQKQKTGPKGPRLAEGLKKVQFNTRLSPFVIDALEGLNKAATVETALIKHLKIKVPKI